MFELAVDGVDETRRASGNKSLRTLRSGVIIGRIWLQGPATLALSGPGVPTMATSHGAGFIVK